MEGNFDEFIPKGKTKQKFSNFYLTQINLS